MTNKALIYTRTSLAAAFSGVPLDTQEQEIIDYANNARLDIIGSYSDNLNFNSTMENRGFKNMLAAFGAGDASHLIVASVDRLSDSKAQLAHFGRIFAKLNVTVHAAASGPVELGADIRSIFQDMVRAQKAFMDKRGK